MISQKKEQSSKTKIKKSISSIKLLPSLNSHLLKRKKSSVNSKKGKIKRLSLSINKFCY